MTTSLEDWIKQSKEHHPIERKIVHKIWTALNDAGTPIVSVYDGEDDTPVSTRKEMDTQVFNLDECFLKVKGGGWVRFVMGNEWDCLVDYTLNLEEALKPVNAYVDRYMV